MQGHPHKDSIRATAIIGQLKEMLGGQFQAYQSLDLDKFDKMKEAGHLPNKINQSRQRIDLDKCGKPEEPDTNQIRQHLDCDKFGKLNNTGHLSNKTNQVTQFLDPDKCEKFANTGHLPHKIDQTSQPIP